MQLLLGSFLPSSWQFLEFLWKSLVSSNCSFIYVGASEEEQSTQADVALGNIPVKDIMTKNVVSVTPSMPVEDLVQFIFEKKHMGYPVMERGNLKGIVTFTDIEHVPYLERPITLISDIMTTNVISIPSNAKASDAMKLIVSKNIGRVMIVDNELLVGILSRTDLVRTLKLRLESGTTTQLKLSNFLIHSFLFRTSHRAHLPLSKGFRFQLDFVQ